MNEIIEINDFGEGKRKRKSGFWYNGQEAVLCVKRPTSSLARFLSSALPLLALCVIITSCPTRMKLHVYLSLIAC